MYASYNSVASLLTLNSALQIKTRLPLHSRRATEPNGFQAPVAGITPPFPPAARLFPRDLDSGENWLLQNLKPRFLSRVSNYRWNSD